MEASPFLTPENSEPETGSMPSAETFINVELLSSLLAEHLSLASFEDTTLSKEACIALFAEKVVDLYEKMAGQAMLPQMIEATWMATVGSLMIQNFLLRVQAHVSNGCTKQVATNAVLKAEA